MTGSTSATPTPVPPDDPTRSLAETTSDDPGATHIGLVGDTYTVLVDGRDTEGKFTVIDMHVPHGGGPAPHRHDFEESFTVVEGEVEATFRGQTRTVQAGQTISVPANAPHSFTNVSARPARMLCVCAPAGQEEFFLEVGVRVDGRTTAPPALTEAEQAAFIRKVAATAPRFGVQTLHP